MPFRRLSNEQAEKRQEPMDFIVALLCGACLIDLYSWFVRFHRQKHTTFAKQQKPAMCSADATMLAFA